MVKSDLYGHSNKLDIPTVTLEKETQAQRQHGLLCKRMYHAYCLTKLRTTQISFWILSKCKWGSLLLIYFPDPLHCTLSHAGCPFLSLATYLPPHIQLNQSGIWGPRLQSITTQISAEAFDIESFVKSVQMAEGRYPCAIGHIHVEISAQGGLSWCSPTY